MANKNRIPLKAYKAAFDMLYAGNDFGAAWACMNKPGYYDLPDSGDSPLKTKLGLLIHEAAKSAIEHAVDLEHLQSSH